MEEGPAILGAHGASDDPVVHGTPVRENLIGDLRVALSDRNCWREIRLRTLVEGVDDAVAVTIRRALVADGRVCDFHALRHSFVSALARGGVHPKVAQQLARYSTITLTMDRYSHTVVGELAAGLQALPDLSPRPDAERLRAAGIADR